jgi:predicted pyridoxine 5'-phosphate oxidase superfamily flavin-nucleotide-binding protein
MIRSPFHEGERAVQERVGVRDRMERLGGRIILDFMPQQHRLFFEEQPFVVVGSLDAEGRPWASLLTGLPGFVSTPDERTLRIEGGVTPGDPLGANLHAGAALGLLGIQLETRRRNRANGVVSSAASGAFTVRVTQSFGNCPKYIQARAPRFSRDPTTPTVSSISDEGEALSASAAAIVAAADTFFIASASARAGSPGASDAGGATGDGVDVSHRGGRPGFVHESLEGTGTVLMFPDYVGNFLFNTLGNLQANPRAGLLFPHFGSGDVLTLTGDTDIVWSGPELLAFEGAERLVRMRVRSGKLLRSALPFTWSRAELAREFG